DPVGVRRRARLRTGWVTARPSRTGRWLAGRRTAGWGTGLVRPSGLRRPRSVFRGRRRAGVAAGCLALRLAGAGSSGTVGGLTIAEEPGYRVDRPGHVGRRRVRDPVRSGGCGLGVGGVVGAARGRTVDLRAGRDLGYR